MAANGCEQARRSPSVPVYRRSAIPKHLRSYRQLADEGLRPAHINKPDGMYARRRSGNPLWTLLYDRRQARPYICATKTGGKGMQILNLKRERYTCTSCGIFVNDWKHFRDVRVGDGRCAVCQAQQAAKGMP